MPTSSLLFFVLPQRKVTKESGTLAYRSARQSSYTAHNPDSADTAIADQLLIKCDMMLVAATLRYISNVSVLARAAKNCPGFYYLSCMDAKQAVVNCIEAVNNGNYTEARKYVTDNMGFVGVFGATDGGDAYIDYLEKKHIRYEVHKVFADGNDVCVLYNLLMGPHSIYGCGWYTLTDGKVSMLKVVFDPRPML